MVKRWRLIALGLITFALAVSVKNDFLLFLFGFEVMLWLASVAQVFWLAHRVKLEIDLPRTTAYRGKPFELRAKLSNTGLLPVPQLLARVAIRVFPEREELLLKGKLMLDSREEGYLCFRLDGTHCGCLEVRADQLTVTDLLGMVQRRCRVNREERFFLFILPECLQEPLQLPDVQGSILADDGSNDRRGSAEIDVSEIRAYRQGDPIRQVHWKLSARLQDLVVREMTDPETPMNWLYVNLQETPGAQQVRKNADAWDHFMESVAMVSNSLLQLDKPHAVLWIDAENSSVVRRDVSDPRSLEQMLCALLRARTYPPRDYAQLLKEIYPDETKGTCIEIDLQGNFIRSEGPR